MFVENLLLALAGAAVGVGLAGAGVPWTASRFPLPGGAVPGIDGRVLAFTLALGVLAGLLAGMVPASVASRFDVGRLLKGDDAPAGRIARRSTVAAGGMNHGMSHGMSHGSRPLSRVAYGLLVLAFPREVRRACGTRGSSACVASAVRARRSGGRFHQTGGGGSCR